MADKDNKEGYLVASVPCFYVLFDGGQDAHFETAKVGKCKFNFELI